MFKKKRTAAPKLITIPLTAQDLTITAFFATQQLLTNLSNAQDPNLLLNDVAEVLHTTPQALAHLPIGTWDDDLLRAIIKTSVPDNTREETSETKTTESTQASEASLPNDSDVLETYPPNTNQTIDTSEPTELTESITLLGIARHLSNLVSDLSAIARENIIGQRKDTKPTKPGTIASHKKAKAKGKKPEATRNNVEQLLPECIWFVHKGVKYFLLGRDADVSLGHIPTNKLTVADYVTMKAVELNAHANAPERDKNGHIFIDRELKAPNGKPTGVVLSDEEYKARMHTLVLQDIDIAFNLSIRQLAVLCRRAHEALPQEISEREAFITERAHAFADAPAWIAFAVRGFFLERLLARRLIPAANLISRDGELLQD
jgi:hypothetical protein